MIRNLKILFAAALTLSALGAMASSAHAVEEFHCSVNPCHGTLKPDGTGKTSHHVFIVENELTTESVSFTCESLSGESFSVGFTEITLEHLAYKNCTANGSAGVTVVMNGCDYSMDTVGGRVDSALARVSCPAAVKIEIKYNGCVISVLGAFESFGIGYTTVGTSPTREVTVTVNHVRVPSSVISATGTKAQCLINPAQRLVGTYTTGNTLVTGETFAGVMADAWYE